jgi:drug/metabolite transporter (DMT)-like permease
VLVATVLALVAAVLHAGWNLAVKQHGDRYVALWGQFVMAGAGSAAVLVVVYASGNGFAVEGWALAAISGVVHVPYCWYLAKAYDHGDFSLVYPVARGGGALLAAFGGIALLGDDLSPLAVAAIVVVAAGLVALAGPTRGPALWSAVAVAVTIGAYSLADARGIRVTDSGWYAFASFVTIAVCVSAFGVTIGKGPALVAQMRTGWRRFAAMGLAVTVTYGLVQLAFRLAPVGYVTALRESSVVIAALVGTRLLGEPAGLRRVAASTVVLGGLVLLVVAG